MATEIAGLDAADVPHLEAVSDREVRVRFGHLSLSLSDALAFAHELSHVVAQGENARERHDRHVNLLARCVFCRYEAGAQTDRLTYDETGEDD